MIITTDNFLIEAAKCYQKRLCFTNKTFYSDVTSLDIKNDVKKALVDLDHLRIRIVLNKIIIATNLFGIRSIDLILFNTKDLKHNQFVCHLLDVVGILPVATKYSKDQTLKEVIDAALRKT